MYKYLVSDINRCVPDSLYYAYIKGDLSVEQHSGH